MNKLSFIPGYRQIPAAIFFVIAGSLLASADDRFSMAIGSHDMLLVLGSHGDRKAELPLPSISTAVSVDGTSFQISYGRDANDLLTAIIAPNPSQPQDLHYTVLGKAIDSDKQAVVTLTFAKSLKSLKIDPGFVGMVEVNSHELRRDSAHNFPNRHLTPVPTQKDMLANASNSSATVATTIAPASTTAATTVPAATPVAANQPSTVAAPSDAANDRVSDHAPDPMQALAANQMPFTASATPGPSTVSSAVVAAVPKQHSLYWSEPITPANGGAPSVGTNEMKLVELQGSVSVASPNGDSHDGQNDMIIPSGSTITTSGGSSVALFMGGVNSIRMLPSSEIEVTQQVSDSVRKTVVNLHDGTIFSRVGHRDGETQSYQVATPEGVSVAKGTEFADSRANGHHYVFVVKGVVGMLINGIASGTLTALPSNVASGAMPPASDGNKVLFAALTALQPFQEKLHVIIDHIKSGTASPAELAYFDNLKKTFTVLVDDVYDPTHPNAFLGAFTSNTGFGDSTHSSLERPQDFANPNPLNSFNGLLSPSHDVVNSTPTPFSTPAVTPAFSGNGLE